MINFITNTRIVTIVHSFHSKNIASQSRKNILHAFVYNNSQILKCVFLQLIVKITNTRIVIVHSFHSKNIASQSRMNIIIDQRSSKLFIYVFIALTHTCTLKKKLFFTWTCIFFGRVHTRIFSVYRYYTHCFNFCSTAGSLRSSWSFNSLVITMEVNHFEAERATRRQKSVFFLYRIRSLRIFIS